MFFRQTRSSRRTWLRWSLAAIAVLTANSLVPISVGQGANVADLKDRLEKDLRVQTPSQFDFIAKVVVAVEDDTLPLGIVDSTYLWARKKPVNRFQYFQQALRLRARQRGIKL